MESHHQVELELDKVASISDSGAQNLQIGSDLVESLLTSWTKPKRVYLIIDRIDLFDGGPDFDTLDLIEQILKVISKVKAEVKVCIVACSLTCVGLDRDDKVNEQWKTWRSLPENQEIGLDKLVPVFKAGWHQQERGHQN